MPDTASWHILCDGSALQLMHDWLLPPKLGFVYSMNNQQICVPTAVAGMHAQNICQGSCQRFSSASAFRPCHADETQPTANSLRKTYNLGSIKGIFSLHGLTRTHTIVRSRRSRLVGSSYKRSSPECLPGMSHLRNRASGHHLFIFLCSGRIIFFFPIADT